MYGSSLLLVLSDGLALDNRSGNFSKVADGVGKINRLNTQTEFERHIPLKKGRIKYKP